MAKNATRKPKVERVSETVRTRSGQVLRLTVSSELLNEAPNRDQFPALRAHLAKMAEVTNA